MKYKVPIYYILVFSAITCAATYFFFYYLNENKQNKSSFNGETNAQSCLGYVKRLEGFKYIRPFVYARKGCESEFMQPLKQTITSVIENGRKNGSLISASVFIKVFGHGEWICINDSENYKPDALMSIPIMITYLRGEELHSGILNKVIKANISNNDNKVNSIQNGKNYTIKELLNYMIAYSDINATKLLYKNLDTVLFKRVFADFDLEVPNFPLDNYTIEIKDFTIFLEALYNAGYITIENSEFAAELLSKCDYNKGLVAGIPDSAIIAHKSGVINDNKIQELHDYGIIISGNKKYEIAVMTKGNDQTKLSEFIKNVSQIAFQKINK